MHRLDSICQKIGRFFKHPVLACETGTCYVTDPANRQHVSSLNIVKYITKPSEGILYSCDIDAGHIALCKEMIVDEFGSYARYIEFLHGDSINSLPLLVNDLRLAGLALDLVFLDSKEHDPDHMLKEFNIMLPALADKHFILIDDVLNANSVKPQKLIPFLDAYNTFTDAKYTKFIANTETGVAIYVKGYDFIL